MGRDLLPGLLSGQDGKTGMKLVEAVLNQILRRRWRSSRCSGSCFREISCRIPEIAKYATGTLQRLQVLQ